MSTILNDEKEMFDTACSRDYEETSNSESPFITTCRIHGLQPAYAYCPICTTQAPIKAQQLEHYQKLEAESANELREANRVKAIGEAAGIVRTLNSNGIEFWIDFTRQNIRFGICSSLDVIQRMFLNYPVRYREGSVVGFDLTW
jgi:hypothetical protein